MGWGRDRDGHEGGGMRRGSSQGHLVDRNVDVDVDAMGSIEGVGAMADTVNSFPTPLTLPQALGPSHRRGGDAMGITDVDVNAAMGAIVNHFSSRNVEATYNDAMCGNE